MNVLLAFSRIAFCSVLWSSAWSCKHRLQGEVQKELSVLLKWKKNCSEHFLKAVSQVGSLCLSKASRNALFCTFLQFLSSGNCVPLLSVLTAYLGEHWEVPAVPVAKWVEVDQEMQGWLWPSCAEGAHVGAAAGNGCWVVLLFVFLASGLGIFIPGTGGLLAGWRFLILVLLSPYCMLRQCEGSPAHPAQCCC